MWTPTVNIYRDPRWGRGIETYGEDPYLTSRMGVMVVKGLQGTNDGKYDKLHACAKHFAVHSGPEWNRHEFNAENIKPRDLYETYLPPFEALVKEGKVKEVMCAYNRFEGDPCCGSDRLLMQICAMSGDLTVLSFRTVELLPIFTETMVIRRILMQSPLRRLRC